MRPPIGAHHATPRSSRRADGSQWTRLPGPRPDRWRRAKTGRGRGGRYLPSPGGVLTYSEWRGTGRAGKEDTRTASREPLKRRLSGPLPALDKLDKHHLRPVASEQQRAGQAPSANSSDGARPAGDLRHEERRPAWRRRRGGGEEEETSQLVASAAPRTRPFILSPLPPSCHCQHTVPSSCFSRHCVLRHKEKGKAEAQLQPRVRVGVAVMLHLHLS